MIKNQLQRAYYIIFNKIIRVKRLRGVLKYTIIYGNF